jgi:hypothetical protein
MHPQRIVWEDGRKFESHLFRMYGARRASRPEAAAFATPAMSATRTPTYIMRTQNGCRRMSTILLRLELFLFLARIKTEEVFPFVPNSNEVLLLTFL